MSMQLSNKLSSIQNNQTVSELNTLLDNAHVRISWGGKRMVYVDGYSGEVEINTLANKYLEADLFDRNLSSTVKEKRDCYNLWGRVQNLYKRSDEGLKKTCIFRWLTPLIEFRSGCRACAGDPQAIIGEWDGGSTKRSLLEFTPERFRELWPNEETDSKSWLLGGGELTERWAAKKEMLDAVLDLRAGMS